MNAWDLVRNAVPWRLKEAARILLAPPGRRSRTGLCCPVCAELDVQFDPLPPMYDDLLDKHGYIHATYLTETINRRLYSCSHCGAADRERLYALYVLKLIEAGARINNILDIAPQPGLTAFFKRHGATDYRTADLMALDVDDRIDIQNMAIYDDNRFDIFICSHVLEHVPNDTAAIRELYRVLKPGGWGICMVPINLGLEDVYERPEITDESGRWKHFGQGDHVRIYSKEGFVSRLRNGGFRVASHGIDYFGEEAFRRHGIHPRSVLYIGHKDAATQPA